MTESWLTWLATQWLTLTQTTSWRGIYHLCLACIPMTFLLRPLYPFPSSFGVALGVPKTESYPTWLRDTSQWEPSLHLWRMEHPFLLDWPNRSEDSLGFGEACLSPSASWQLRKVGGGVDTRRQMKLREKLRHLSTPLELLSAAMSEHAPRFPSGKPVSSLCS